jgi:hypothetical protein
VLVQGWRIGSGGDDEVDVLRQVMSDAVETVDHIVHMGQGFVCCARESASLSRALSLA